MLTRLRVSGFKNLVDVDVSFGPFTCVAGANGVGKSNLLDAIQFLSSLASGTILDAALSVRDLGGRTGDLRGLFHHVGDHYAEEMTFEAEMIIPEQGTDDLGQIARASSTFVQYSVSLRYRSMDAGRTLGSLELVREELKHITLRDAARHLGFPHSISWRKAAIKNSRRTAWYISTEGAGPERKVSVHPDRVSRGKPQTLLAATLPRTVLSAANSAESPTATLVRREMQSWRLLQLEPSALREPDSFTAPAELGVDGAHLPATLFHLANGPGVDSEAVYAEVANRVSQLIGDVRSVYVDREERRQLLTLYAIGADKTAHPARALSDGTLRFLALTVLSLDPNAQGVICMEEPENGIHVERIPAMLELLQDLTADVTEDDGDEETGARLRQVIVNTHSPSVVLQVPDESLIYADAAERRSGDATIRALRLRCLPGTWRTQDNGGSTIPKGVLLAYLNPVGRQHPARRPRVVDRQDLQQYLLPFPGAAS